MSGPLCFIGWWPGPAGAGRLGALSRVAATTLVCVGLGLVGAGAQARPAPAPAGASKAPAASGAVPQVAPPQSYVYDPEGRRDPFIPLLNRGDQRGPGGLARPDGLPGLMVGDVALKGIVFSRGGYWAMIQGPDTKTFIVRNGDRLFDGTVKAVTADAIVFVQQVNDPLSLVKQREVRKPLRPIEEGK